MSGFEATKAAILKVLKEEGKAKAITFYWETIMERKVRFGKAVAFVNQLEEAASSDGEKPDAPNGD